jgi:hypothetical protein
MGCLGGRTVYGSVREITIQLFFCVFGFRTGATRVNLFEGWAASGEFLLDRLDRRCPKEWLGAFIPGGEESGNGRLKILDA